MLNSNLDDIFFFLLFPGTDFITFYLNLCEMVQIYVIDLISNEWCGTSIWDLIIQPKSQLNCYDSTENYLLRNHCLRVLYVNRNDIPRILMVDKMSKKKKLRHDQRNGTTRFKWFCLFKYDTLFHGYCNKWYCSWISFNFNFNFIQVTWKFSLTRFNMK